MADTAKAGRPANKIDLTAHMDEVHEAADMAGVARGEARADLRAFVEQAVAAAVGAFIRGLLAKAQARIAAKTSSLPASEGVVELPKT